MYTKECGSFDKFLPLYLYLRCLGFSKLHGKLRIWDANTSINKTLGFLCN
ncbi:hypothetical protein Gotur_029595 [Gossypium turneri]